MARADEQLRKSFEVSMLFHPELHGEKIPKAGLFAKDPDGTYTFRRIERIYEGYRLAMNSKDGRLERFSPDRNIANGHLTELRNALGSNGEVPSVEQIRTILKVVGGWPV